MNESTNAKVDTIAGGLQAQTSTAQGKQKTCGGRDHWHVRCCSAGLQPGTMARPLRVELRGEELTACHHLTSANAAQRSIHVVLKVMSSGGSACSQAGCPRPPMLQLGSSTGSSGCPEAPLQRSNSRLSRPTLLHRAVFAGKRPERFFLWKTVCSAELLLLH